MVSKIIKTFGKKVICICMGWDGLIIMQCSALDMPIAIIILYRTNYGPYLGSLKRG